MIFIGYFQINKIVQLQSCMVPISCDFTQKLRYCSNPFDRQSILYSEQTLRWIVYRDS